jgi:Na+/melibiose symporter-like transporter
MAPAGEAHERRFTRQTLKVRIQCWRPWRNRRLSQPQPLTIRTKLFYGFGTVAFGVKDNGFSYLLLPFYNQVVGLPAPLVGFAILVAMMFDALIDPIIGQVSDNWRSRWGRRHPFMYGAALPVAVSYLLLWNPPHWPQGALFFYLIAVAVLIRGFISVYEVPSSALSAELSQGYDERTVLLSYRYFFGWIGGLVLYIITFRFLLVPDAHHPVGQTNPVGFSRYGLLAAGIMLVAILVSAAGTHDRIPTLKQITPRRLGIGAMLREIFATWSHRSFLFLTLSGVATSMAAGLSASMNFYFNTYFWGFSSPQISALALGVVVSAFMALSLAPIVSRRYGKRTAAIGAMIAAVVVGLAPMTLRVLGLAPANHTEALFLLVLAQSVISVAFYIAGATLVSAMIADVVEEGELRTGRRAEGVYFSASIMVSKATSGLGIFAASGVLAFIHFPTGVRPDAVPASTLINLALAYGPLYTALYVIGLLLMLGYEITRTSHAETLQALAARAPAAE